MFLLNRFTFGLHGLSAWLPVGVAGLLSWGIWLTRWLLSRGYRPSVADFDATTSVVVPCFREDPDTFERCLQSWLAEEPDEIIVVPDVDDAEILERLERVSSPRLRVIPIVHHGKRDALGVGIRAARGEILLLCDSDTAWLPGLVREVQRPFADPRVGGVSTRQLVYARRTSIWRRAAAWMLNTRYLDYVPSMSRFGAVPCISGRTAAYRRRLILPVLDQLEHEIFMGKECVAGDDTRLTWLVLGQGWRTVYQSSACATSMFPDQAVAFFRQRLRWSRNSYRAYLTAAKEGWLWRQPILTQLTVAQYLITPITMGITLSCVVSDSTGLVSCVACVALLAAGRAVRGLSHLLEHPDDVAMIPVMTVLMAVLAMPLKVYAFLTMNVHGWLTRHDDSRGSDGGSEVSTLVRT